MWQFPDSKERTTFLILLYLNSCCEDYWSHFSSRYIQAMIVSSYTRLSNLSVCLPVMSRCTHAGLCLDPSLVGKRVPVDNTHFLGQICILVFNCFHRSAQLFTRVGMHVIERHERVRLASEGLLKAVEYQKTNQAHWLCFDFRMTKGPYLSSKNYSQAFSTVL